MPTILVGVVLLEGDVWFVKHCAGVFGTNGAVVRLVWWRVTENAPLGGEL